MTLRIRRVEHRHDAVDDTAPTQDAHRRDRLVGRAAWVMAWVGLVGGQLHALARFRTAEGIPDLDTGLTRTWVEPADGFLDPLLSWGRPDLVYVTYGKIWFPVFVAFTLCAFVVYRRTRPTGFLRWSWRAALTAYVLACIGVFIDYWTQWTGRYAGIEETLFTVGWAVTFPAFLLTMGCSTVLGVTLLVHRFRPLPPAMLLALTVPLAAAILMVTSMGSAALPVMFAFGLLGRRLARRG